MSYMLELFVDPLPVEQQDLEHEWKRLRDDYYNIPSEPHEKFFALHDVLTARYPCLCSYEDDDPDMDDSPWADGPLIENFRAKMGMVAVVGGAEVLEFIIEEALKLGLTVIDPQGQNDVYRPD